MVLGTRQLTHTKEGQWPAWVPEYKKHPRTHQFDFKF